MVSEHLESCALSLVTPQSLTHKKPRTWARMSGPKFATFWGPGDGAKAKASAVDVAVAATQAWTLALHRLSGCCQACSLPPKCTQMTTYRLCIPPEPRFLQVSCEDGDSATSGMWCASSNAARAPGGLFISIAARPPLTHVFQSIMGLPLSPWHRREPGDAFEGSSNKGVQGASA